MQLGSLDLQQVTICGRSKNYKSGAKRGARADNRPGPRVKVNAMSKEVIIPKKKNGGQTLNIRCPTGRTEKLQLGVGGARMRVANIDKK